MADRITLPRLLRFKLAGFQPIFKRDVEMSLNGGPYVVLGGNGLGKTTIAQALVYGLAGDVNEAIEEQKPLRWNHDYFRQRLDRDKVDSAFVEVEFRLGKSQLGVRRGFSNSAVCAFKPPKTTRWIEDSDQAQKAFNEAILAYGGYRNSADFAFIVNRLLYLAESRRLLAWDSNAQVRIIMLLNQDAVIEEDFRRRRKELKEMDSNKRHVHVALGKINQRLERLKVAKKSPVTVAAPTAKPKVDLMSLVEQAERIAKQRVKFEKVEQHLSASLTNVSSQIEVLREQIERAEAILLSSVLDRVEIENSLPLFNLADNGICPACGTRQPGLQSVAHQHIAEGKCIICGSDELQEAQPELSTLRSQLSESIRSQQAIEGDYRIATIKTEGLKRQEERLQIEINKIRYEQPVIALLERDLQPTTKASLLNTKRALEHQEADLQAQILSRQRSMEKDYQRFRTAVDARIKELRQTYASYATEFLGIPCSLTETTAKENVSFSRFVPEFNGLARESPESCSESQRFFLDIAFRLALIDHVSQAKGQGATFICETPENALDMSYIDNVVRMFKQFLNKGHSLFVTANIQKDSFARTLLQAVPKAQHKNHVLNLLDFGQLGKVHTKALPKLRATARKIVG